MINLIYTIILSSCILACAPPLPSLFDENGLLDMKGPEVVYIEPDVQPLVNDFINTGNALGRTIIIKSLLVVFESEVYKVAAKTNLATCFYGLGKTPRIVIRPSVFYGMSYWERRELVFHELGHCILGLEHNEKRSSPNGPVESIMHPYHQGQAVYGPHSYIMYDQQLFLGNNKKVSGLTW